MKHCAMTSLPGLGDSPCPCSLTICSPWHGILMIFKCAWGMTDTDNILEDAVCGLLYLCGVFRYALMEPEIFNATVKCVMDVIEAGILLRFNEPNRPASVLTDIDTLLNNICDFTDISTDNNVVKIEINQRYKERILKLCWGQLILETLQICKKYI